MRRSSGSSSPVNERGISPDAVGLPAVVSAGGLGPAQLTDGAADSQRAVEDMFQRYHAAETIPAECVEPHRGHAAALGAVRRAAVLTGCDRLFEIRRKASGGLG